MPNSNLLTDDGGKHIYVRPGVAVVLPLVRLGEVLLQSFRLRAKVATDFEFVQELVATDIARNGPPLAVDIGVDFLSTELRRELAELLAQLLAL